MDPFTALLMGGTALSSFANSQAQRSQARDALDEQRRMNSDQMRLASASRTDAYGNQTYYDPVTNSWKTNLDPYQDRIIKAGETEQFRGLTEDAAQNRAVRGRAFERGGQAAEDYNRSNAELKYGYNPSEGAVKDKLTELMSLAQPRYLNPAGNIRTAGKLPIVVSNSSTMVDDPVSRLAKIMLQARQGATSEVGNRSTARNNRALPAMQQYNQVAGGGGGAPTNYSTTPDRLQAQEGDMSKLVQSAYNNSIKNIGNAQNHLITAMGKNPGPSYGDALKIGGAISDGTDKANNASQSYYGGSPSTNPNLNPNTYNYYNDSDWKDYTRDRQANGYPDTFNQRFGEWG